jgi:hypothetical protein
MDQLSLQRDRIHEHILALKRMLRTLHHTFAHSKHVQVKRRVLCWMINVRLKLIHQRLHLRIAFPRAPRHCFVFTDVHNHIELFRFPGRQIVSIAQALLPARVVATRFVNGK